VNILITGLNGFIGKHLVKEFSNHPYKIYALVRQSTDKLFFEERQIPFFVFENNINELIQYIQDNNIEGIIHLASLFIKDHKSEDIQNLISSNILLGSGLLEAATRGGVKWFINTGTYWQHFENQDYCPANLYAATKQSFESIAKYYTETSDLIFVTIKLNDTFGTEDTRAKIMNLLVKIAKSKESLKMSPGGQIMEITHIDNIVDLYLKMVSMLQSNNASDLNGKSFSPKAKERLTLKELVSIFEVELGQKLNIEWGGSPYRNREVMTPWEYSEVLPGWVEKTSIREGIKLFLREQKLAN
jgi:CDP-paratose synthetase